MRRSYTLAGLLLTLTVLAGPSAAGRTKLTSLSDYVSAALRNNPLIGSAARAREAAVYKSEAIRKSRYPQIGVGSSLLFAPGYDPLVTNGGEFAAQISGSYTIYDGGAKRLEASKGRVGVEEGTIGENRIRADVVYGVSNAYVEAVKQKRELKITEEEYTLLSDYLRLIKQLHAAGQGSETDLLKTMVDLNNTSIEINSRRVSYRNSLIALAQAAGLPSSEVTNVDSVMPLIPYDTTFDASGNIDIAAQALVLKQALLDAQIAGAKFRPIVSVNADAGALASLPTLERGPANVFGASVGLSVSMPVFTFGSMRDNYDAAAANARSIELRDRYSVFARERDFEATRNDIVKSDSEVAALRRNLVIAKRNMILSKAQYAGGIGLSLDVLNAIQMVNQIRLSIENARASRAMSIVKLRRLNYSGAY